MRQITIVVLCCAFLFSFIAYAEMNTTVSTPISTQPLALQMSVIAKNVQAAGYPLITEMELKDGMYKVKALDIQGTSIDIVVDPQKGTIVKPKETKRIQVSLPDAITLVEKKGYHGVYKVQADDGTYDVYALDSQGSKVTLAVNAITGNVNKSWF